jgi:hypothetical protein
LGDGVIQLKAFSAVFLPCLLDGLREEKFCTRWPCLEGAE